MCGFLMCVLLIMLAGEIYEVIPTEMIKRIYSKYQAPSMTDISSLDTLQPQLR